jgi:hypothetical protein
VSLADRIIAGQRYPHDFSRVLRRPPLVNGGTLEIHGYATHWTKEDVDVAWTDDHRSQNTCWVTTKNFRRPVEGEWHGNYLPR